MIGEEEEKIEYESFNTDALESKIDIRKFRIYPNRIQNWNIDLKTTYDELKEDAKDKYKIKVHAEGIQEKMYVKVSVVPYILREFDELRENLEKNIYRFRE